jgi:methylated-DNA-[protein]-cysteine S-methyltransferase
MTIKRYIWKNKSGWCMVEWTDSGLTSFDFGYDKKGNIINDGLKTVKIIKELTSEAKWIRDAVAQLDDYFAGTRTVFKTHLDFAGATEFQCGVWKAAIKIPYGKTCSYAELAAAVGSPRSARAVGNALGANPLPVIVPCHRVLKSDGALGGFSLGIEVKKSLLSLERGDHVQTIEKRIGKSRGGLHKTCLWRKDTKTKWLEEI